MRRRVSRQVVAVAAAMALVASGSACGGPKPSASFGGKSVAVNVSFGKPAPDDPRAPQEPFVLAPVTGGIGVVPVEAPRKPREVGGPVLPPPEPPVTCPPKDIVKPPVDEAPRGLGAAPPEGPLSYRIEGKVEGRDIAGSFTRTIENVFSGASFVSFDVRTKLLGVESVHGYGSSGQQDRLPGQVGLYRVSAEGRGIDGRPSFSSNKGLRLLQLDATFGQTWNDAVTDPLSATTITVGGSNLGKAKVWACGENIDTWQVKLTQEVVTPLQRITSEITYWIATQYGGLIVQEAVSWSGTAGLDRVSGQYTATINEVPGQ